MKSFRKRPMKFLFRYEEINRMHITHVRYENETRINIVASKQNGH